MYAANIAVAGTVDALALFAPALAGRTVFGGTAGVEVSMRVTGTFWLASAVLSYVGERAGALPLGMAFFFVTWVVTLPFVIPWREIFSAGA